jgi:competence protein ComGC
MKQIFNTKWDLLIIIVLIALIASIAVPNLINKEQHMNEMYAVDTLRRIADAQKSYHTKNGVYGTITQLHSEDPRIDHYLAEASPNHGYSSYFYILTLDGGKNWCCVAKPTMWDQERTGAKNYMIGRNGVVYYNTEEDSSDFTKKVGE